MPSAFRVCLRYDMIRRASHRSVSSIVHLAALCRQRDSGSRYGCQGSGATDDEPVPGAVYTKQTTLRRPQCPDPSCVVYYDRLNATTLYLLSRTTRRSHASRDATVDGRREVESNLQGGSAVGRRRITGTATKPQAPCAMGAMRPITMPIYTLQSLEHGWRTVAASTSSSAVSYWGDALSLYAPCSPHPWQQTPGPHRPNTAPALAYPPRHQ